jgi:hypothetical protein
MAKGRHELLRSDPVTHAHPAAMAARSGAPPDRALAAAAFDDPAVTYNFWGRVQGMDYPSLSPVQQNAFKAHLERELASLNSWCMRQRWLPSQPVADLKIFVSDEYKVSKALMPASVGQRGRIEIPAWKAVAGEAAIAHELVHVYFPNGNRLLAEGLAVYLQAEIGGNPAFPNFGQPLNRVARDMLRKMAPEFAAGGPARLDKLRLADLDKIATPSPLRLRVGLNLYQDDPFGQAHIYPIVGSFAQFLIETRGLKKFQALYEKTPLKPFERNPGSPDRWAEVYELPLEVLETQWKSKFDEGADFA